MRRTVLLAAFATAGIVAGIITCTGVGPHLVDDGAAVSLDDDPPPPPFVRPEPPPGAFRGLPDYGREHRDFPFLPDEEQRAPRSVGTVTDGYLVNGRRIALPHPHLEFLDRQFDRRLHYTSGAMIELLSDAGAHVADAYPERTVHLGNLSRRGGGDIPHSVSHNNGRDADIAFFVVDHDGEPTRPPDLVPMDENGVFDPAQHDDYQSSDPVLHFDVSANWRLIEGLIDSDAAELQYIFVSNPLRDSLLEQARRQDSSPTTLQIARQVLVQPGGQTPPHDDHFHIRIHCSTDDFAAGCKERGRPGPTFQPDYSRRTDIIRRARQLLDDDNPQLRLTAVRRLHRFDDHGQEDRVIELLDDPDKRVRIAAIRLVDGYQPAAEALIRRLTLEDTPRVFVELVDTLSGYPSATPALIEALQRDERIEWSAAEKPIPTVGIVAHALAGHGQAQAVPELLEALEVSPPGSRSQIAHTLRILTNHRFVSGAALGDDEDFQVALQTWRDWWDQNHEYDREQWLIDGFQQSGFDVSALDKTDVWELCRAISADRHLSVNAQRTLEDISGQSVGSLQWDAYDASFYWRRWFERRQDRFELASIPPGLSTADGYTPPEDDNP